jgi:hypothetical protein
MKEITGKSFIIDIIKEEISGTYFFPVLRDKLRL